MPAKTRFENELSVWETRIDDYVAAAAWSFDGAYICAASSAGWLYIYEADTGQKLFARQTHPEGINAMAASPTAHRVVTAGKDAKIHLCDGISGELLKELDGGAPWVEHATWATDGQHFATAAGKMLSVWTADGELLFSHRDFASTISAIYWRDGRHLAVACYGTIALFDIGGVFAPYEILFWKTPMISLSWRKDGAYLLAGTQDARIQVWKLPYTPESELEMSGYVGKVKELSWHHGNNSVATNCGSEVIIWDTSDAGPQGRAPVVLRGHVGKITQLAYQRCGDLLVSCDVVGLILIRHPQNPSFRIEGVSESPVCAAAWSPDDDRLLFGTEAGEIMVWDAPF